MKSRVRRARRCLLAVGAASAAAAARRADAAALRVCADPNNLPFSNRARRRVREPHRRAAGARLGSARSNTPGGRSAAASCATRSAAGACDVRDGRADAVRAGRHDACRTTDRATCSCRSAPAAPRVCVARRSARCARLRIGVQMIGDDFANSPPAHALSSRGMVTQRRRLLGARRLLAAEPAGAHRRGGRARRRGRGRRLGAARRVLRRAPGRCPSTLTPGFAAAPTPPRFRSCSTSPWPCGAATAARRRRSIEFIARRRARHRHGCWTQYGVPRVDARTAAGEL